MIHLYCFVVSDFIGEIHWTSIGEKPFRYVWYCGGEVFSSEGTIVMALFIGTPLLITTNVDILPLLITFSSSIFTILASLSCEEGCVHVDGLGMLPTGWGLLAAL